MSPLALLVPLAVAVSPGVEGGAVTAPGATPAWTDDSSTIQVAIDSARHELIVTVGPFRLEDMSHMDHHAMEMDDGGGHDTPVFDFVWPVEGWFRGFRIAVLDENGNALPRDLMHHMIVVNYDRRQLLYPAAERIMGAGSETDDFMLPKTVGVPVPAGTRLGMYVAWHNATGAAIERAYLRLALAWTPKNQMPRPVSGLPVYMDVNLTVGKTNTFDVPPGRSEKSYEFELPVGGRLLGVSGHLHDYGVEVRLEEARSNRIVTEVEADRTPDGAVAGMEIKLFGVSGRGKKIHADRRYRVVGVYDNPTGETIRLGAMAEIVGLFVPDDLALWPALDPNDPTLQLDLASLREMGQQSAGMNQGGGGATGQQHKHDPSEHNEGH